MAEGREIQRLDTGKEPHHLYPTPDGRSLIVANAMSNSLLLLDPRTGARQREIRDIPDPYQIGFTWDDRRFVVNALRLDRIDIYDFDGSNFRIAKRIPAPTMPSHMAFSRDNRFVYVTLQGTDRVVAIDLNALAIAWTVQVGSAPAGIYMTPDGRHLLVGIMGRDYVEVIDVAQRASVKRIRTGDGAHNFRALGDGRIVLIGNRVANTVTAIDLATLEAAWSMPLPGGPDDMEITADGKELWVTSRFARRVTVVDLVTRKQIRSIVVGRSPHGIFFVDRTPIL